MSGYNILARYYDTFTKNINYNSLAKRYIYLLKKYGVKDGLIFDLACGTGNISIPLRRAGFDVTGIDLSADMLSVAKEKADNEGFDDILFLKQDMRSLDLYGTYSAGICALDGINHLLKTEDVIKTLKRIKLFLDPGGMFIFDLNTPKRFLTEYSDKSYIFDTDEVFCSWQNSFNEKTGICKFSLSFFEKDGDVYLRSDECFSERVYTVKEMTEYLKTAGFETVGIYGDDGKHSPTENDSKYYICARSI